MKNMLLILVLGLTCTLFSYGQQGLPAEQERKLITALIDQYSTAREKRDTSLLKTILTRDVDQLVSTGEWRSGIAAAVDGMIKSSATRPGTRTLKIDKIRMIDLQNAIVDCRYEIQSADGSLRKMWSTFFVVADKQSWKIAAIRNMLPSEQ